MPPKPLNTVLDPILHGPTRGLGAVNRTSNDKPGVVVLDGGEARELVAKLRPYGERRPDTMKDLYQRIERGTINLTGDAATVLNRYVFFANLPLMNFQAATLGAAVGRMPVPWRALQER